MEEDGRSDSGVSTLRSDGARSSGDERSGSRSSALSDERTSRPSSLAPPDPDIKIVGTVPGRAELASQYLARPGMTDPRHLPPLSHYPAQPSPAAILQYQHLAAAAAMGISPEALLPQHLHPATELLLERERQMAQERDRALR